MVSAWEYAKNKHIIIGAGTTLAGGYLSQALPGPSKKLAGILAAAGILTATYGVYKVSRVGEERERGIIPTEEQIEQARQDYRPYPMMSCTRIGRHTSFIRGEFADLTFYYTESAFDQLGGFHFHMTDEKCEDIIDVKVNGRPPAAFYIDQMEGFRVLEVYAIPPNSKITFTVNLADVLLPFGTLMSYYRTWVDRANFALDCNMGILESFRCPEIGECDPRCYGLHTGAGGDLFGCPSLHLKIPQESSLIGTEYYEVEDIDQGKCR